MKHYLLCPDMDVSPCITLTENGSCFETIWENGRVVDTAAHDLSRLEFICETSPAEKYFDFAISDMGCPVVSERLKNLLDGNGVNNIEYFPATVLEEERQNPKEGYYAANIIGLVDCLDKEHSEFDGYFKDGVLKAISGIEELSLLEEIQFPAHIFRMYLFRRIILIHESFKRIFEEAGISGVKFIQPENWDGYYGEK